MPLEGDPPLARNIMTMPAAIYLRVSREDQHPENQRPALETMAEGRGYSVTRAAMAGTGHIYIDHGISGAKGKAERPGLAALLDAAARGEIRAVFVWDLDRLSRDGSLSGGLQIVAELDRCRVAVLSHRQTWLDTSGPFREPLIALAFAMAQEERAKLVERSKAGVERARAAGRKIGRPVETVPDEVIQLALGYRGIRGFRGPTSWRKISRLLAERDRLYQPARMFRADRKRGLQARLRHARPWPAATLRAAVQAATAKGKP
jgi:DNA invertase Pin-like site-specific DNA recombinase